MTDTEPKTCSLSTPGESPVSFVADKDTKPLEGEEAACAIKELNNTDFVRKFKASDRNYADPGLHLQQYGLFSFIPAKGAIPNKNGIFGFAKQRGNFQTEDEASARAEMLIKDCDSTHTIFHTYVGRPFPLTVSDKYAAETSEVDIRKETTEAVSTTIKDKKNADKKAMEEIKAREEELMADTSGTRDKAEVDEEEYITTCVKNAQLSWSYMEHVTKMKEIRLLIMKARAELKELDSTNPQFKANYLAKYAAARKKAGINTSKADLETGFMKYMGCDVLLNGIDDNEGDFDLNKIINSDTAKPTTVFVTDQHKEEEDEDGGELKPKAD
jgi:hypothetical protein